MTGKDDPRDPNYNPDDPYNVYRFNAKTGKVDKSQKIKVKCCQWIECFFCQNFINELRNLERRGFEVRCI